MAPGEKPLRWNWDTPFIISPHDPHTLYIGANRSTDHDQGAVQQVGESDLSLWLDRDTVETAGPRSDIRIARHDATLPTDAVHRGRVEQEGLLYAGSDDGQVNVSKDGGVTWSNVTAKILAARGRMSRRSSRRSLAEGTGDVRRPPDGRLRHLCVRAIDYGASFKSISANLPSGWSFAPNRRLKNAGVIYAGGAETGLFVTTDRGKSWTRIKANLPTVPVYEITSIRATTR
ncbi:MAG: hypothetical protein R2882_12930 [Gemmatimonadales bacterium]